MNYKKYRKSPVIDYPERQWPNKQLKAAPKWCSVDLRDGNQSLVTPFTMEQKLDFFQFLVKVGFKEIEVGFPAAAEGEFLFVRKLIEENLIPDDVTIQVLTQSREPLIRKTFESLAGAKNATVHLYNATSPLFREVVFKRTKEETIRLAVEGAELFNKLVDESGYSFEYSPECFSQTEPDFVVDVCNAVISCWQGRQIIINLPFTVESHTPNVHADMVEYVLARLKDRENITISLHAHNDRGTAVAATELCLLAGADRVEGTLFGNGERTGNADIITLAMNLYSQGIDPGLDFSDIDDAISLYTDSTCLPVHPRHPYVGELVYTAFSGSHQDAIRKGMANLKDGDIWDMPYLPIDPKDVGRGYDPIIRVNSQSGSSSVAYILETKHELPKLPKAMQRDFGLVVTNISDTQAAELTPDDIYSLFRKTYVNVDTPMGFVGKQSLTQAGEIYTVVCTVQLNGKEVLIEGKGRGPMDAFRQGLLPLCNINFDIGIYSQQTLNVNEGAEAPAISYIEIIINGKSYFGAGISRSTTNSSLKAIVSALNRYLKV